MLLLVDVAELVQTRDGIVALVRDEEFGFAESIGDELEAARLQRVEAGLGVRADEERLGHELLGAADEGGVGDVDLVEDGDDRPVGGAEFTPGAGGEIAEGHAREFGDGFHGGLSRIEREFDIAVRAQRSRVREGR